jgi:cysteine desulfurase/selenocysteine lyase
VNGLPLAYLDSAASAQKPNQVIDAEAAFYRHGYAAVHRGIHTLSAEATAYGKCADAGGRVSQCALT